MVAWVWVACGGQDKASDGDTGVPVDDDGDGWLAAEDCDDADALVHPEARDFPYDGLDADCAGDDDYDQDGDGHRATGFEGGDDCNDENPDISPSAAEVPYDGQDNDCSAETRDDDVDGDGFARALDCDDEDAAASPDGVEVAFDGVDQDCDGQTDTGPFGEPEWAFTTPRAVRALDTPFGFAAMVRADAVDIPGQKESEDHPVAILAWEDGFLGPGVPRTPPTLAWGRANADPTDAEAIALDGDRLQVGLVWVGSNQFGLLAAQPLDFINGVGWFPGALSYREEVFQEHTSVAVWTDGPDVWVAGSGAAGVGYARSGGVPAVGGLTTAATGGAATFQDPGAPSTFVTCEAASGCTSWDFDPAATDPAPTPASAQPWAGRQVLSAHARAGELVWIDASGLHWTDGAVERTPFATPPVDGDVVVIDGELFAVAVAGGDLTLAHGPAAGPYVEVDVPVLTVSGERFSATAAALAVDSDSLLLVVGGDGGGRDAVLHQVVAR